MSTNKAYGSEGDDNFRINGDPLQPSSEATALVEDSLCLRIHKHYNREGITQYNIVPGLMGVVLTDGDNHRAGDYPRTRDDGKPADNAGAPLEVMTGKIVPSILVGYGSLPSSASSPAGLVGRRYQIELGNETKFGPLSCLA